MLDFENGLQPVKADESPQEYSVSEISLILKGVVEDNFSYVRVRGEVSGLKIAASGHVYFNLKDNEAVLSAIVWRGVATTMNFKIEEGAEVVCSGKITTYPGRSQYQIIASSVKPAGIGALLAMLEARKKKLQAMGLFDKSRKRAIPKFPNVIGVVTSPTGAVIKDILHRIGDRYPVHVLIWPVLVQGPGSAEQIANAINNFNNLPSHIAKPDVLIVARGGGSIEDLWAFNEEVVAMAAANSAIPLISAVGHETDVTLIDYVADLRAPTPTAAAELCTPVFADLLNALKDYGARLKANALAIVEARNDKLNKVKNLEVFLQVMMQRFSQRLERSNSMILRLLERFIHLKVDSVRRTASRLNASGLLMRPLDNNVSKLKMLESKMHNAFKLKAEKAESTLELNIKLLESYHYKKVLQRGFAILRNDDEKLITSIQQIKVGQNMNLELVDGVIKVKESS